MDRVADELAGLVIGAEVLAAPVARCVPRGRAAHPAPRCCRRRVRRRATATRLPTVPVSSATARTGDDRHLPVAVGGAAPMAPTGLAQVVTEAAGDENRPHTGH